ncbi:DUF6044 family protein [Salibacterium qingdaonense]|uniref:YkoS n=1 Tax=Salibacterium qingdaonense TaxID=266892 RepID=A0A1I4HUX2_9BACI|nr:DUF6044 family protein [Salibacterium qingdaonense]SFL45884.1 hypothetical protein SAMN04488054_10129 [Salibacterium qingdaonense]
MRERTWILISVGLILAYLSPLVILGEGAHLRIHDNLDSNLIWYKTLVENNVLFAPNDKEIPSIMNGLPREALSAELSMFALLFTLFDPFPAYAVNLFLMRFTAFFGMLLLLKKHILPKTKAGSFISVGTALAFSLPAFWPFGGLSFAGVPLVLYAFLNIRKQKNHWTNWLILILVPFYSSFIVSFIFFLAIMGIFWLVDAVRYKKPNWKFVGGIALMTALYLVKQYRLVYGELLGKGFTPHRVEFDRGYRDWDTVMNFFGNNLLHAHSHSYVYHYPFAFFTAVFALLFTAGIIAVRRLKRKRQPEPLTPGEKAIPALLLMIVVFSFWISIWNWEGMRVLKDAVDLINEFNFGRFHLLNVVTWYIVFALSLMMIQRRIKFGMVLVVLLLIGQVAGETSRHHEFKYRSIDYPSYEEFYAEDLFSDIQDYIGQDPSEYRVVSIGMHPAVAQYNGFYTLDFYVTMYPLEYKHQFENIIEGELAKNDTLENYYNTWGGRVYAFSDELGKNYLFTKNNQETINNLDFGTEAFKEMGGEYVLSAVEIENAGENNLELEKVFENESAAWKIRLYRAES